jgi:hypothetical protein
MKFVVCGTVAAVLASAVLADYSPNLEIPYAYDLDCTSCIRGGFDYCINGTVTGTTPLGTNWECNKLSQEPEIVWPKPDGTQSGYICSNAMKDQMAAIISGCRPVKNNIQQGYTCGNYMVDLTSEAFPQRQIKNMTVNQTCTYRAYTTCGYPAAAVSINNEIIMEDFDIVYASADISLDSDLGSDYLLNDTTSWNGNFNTDDSTYNKQISAGFHNDAVDESFLTTCKGTPKNLWISVTRVKETRAKVEEQFLTATPRQLQGTKTYAIELQFANIQGGQTNAKILATATFALMALLSIFTF